MATEEVNKPSLPQYPEMIFAAIAALNEKNGSNKSAISKYIESQYADLPAGHSDLLSIHLNRLKESGDLVLVKNNYMRPSPNPPPKRGRGRPPKPKVPMPSSGLVASPPRPRGRPPKPRDPNAAPTPKVSSGRPRGRPPKKAKTGGAAPVTRTGPPRPRGRPPKVRAPFASTGFD